jgi:uncharacterized protein YoxC
MAEDKTADDKIVEKQSAKKTKAAESSGKKTTVKKTAPKTAKAAAKPAAKPAASKAAGKPSSAKKEPELKASKDALAAIEKAGASKDTDMKAAAKKISDLEKKAADDSIKSKKSVEELKARAAEAKKRAQQKILEKSFVGDKPEDPLERLANTFDNSAKRWEMVVYPSLFAFVLLAGYGFFLIYRLTHDIAVLSQSVTHMAVIVSDAMPRMTKDLNAVTDSMDNMTGNIAGMTGDIGGMTTEIVSMSNQMNSLTPMSKNIQSMTHNIGSMNRSVYGMQRDMHGMNRTVSSGPFGMMNDIMPFTSDTNVPPPLAPQPVWPSYSAVPQQYPYYNQAPAFRAPKAVTPAAPQATTQAAPAKKAENTAKVGDADSKVPAKTAPASKNAEVIMPGTSPVTLKEVSN